VPTPTLVQHRTISQGSFVAFTYHTFASAARAHYPPQAVHLQLIQPINHWNTTKQSHLNNPAPKVIKDSALAGISRDVSRKRAVNSARPQPTISLQPRPNPYSHAPRSSSSEPQLRERQPPSTIPAYFYLQPPRSSSSKPLLRELQLTSLTLLSEASC
jgi:hypothetical protein